MAKINLNDYWAAIDIGTTKICALIARYDSRGDIEVVGIASRDPLKARAWAYEHKI